MKTSDLGRDTHRSACGNQCEAPSCAWTVASECGFLDLLPVVFIACPDIEAYAGEVVGLEVLDDAVRVCIGVRKSVRGTPWRLDFEPLVRIKAHDRRIGSGSMFFNGPVRNDL